MHGPDIWAGIQSTETVCVWGFFCTGDDGIDNCMK
jgi:hypothetical protein